MMETAEHGASSLKDGKFNDGNLCSGCGGEKWSLNNARLKLSQRLLPMAPATKPSSGHGQRKRSALPEAPDILQAAGHGPFSDISSVARIERVIDPLQRRS